MKTERIGVRNLAGIGIADIDIYGTKQDLNKSEVTSCIWCDKNGNEITAIEYGTTEIYCQLNCINFTKSFISNIHVLLLNQTVGNYQIKITKEKSIFRLNLVEILKKSTFRISMFYLSIKNKDKSILSKPLKIHFVIFIPETMDKLKWPTAAKVQREWFNNISNNYPWEANPRLNFYEFDWALGFARFNKHFIKYFDNWKSEKSINSLKKEIRKMVAEKYVTLPNSTTPETTFGSFENDNKLVRLIITPDELNNVNTPCNVPLFDKFYYSTLEAYNESKFNAELDDFYGAIANTSIRIIASGVLKFENNKVKVIVKKIGFYIKDGFDFVGDQGLGNWTKNNVTTNILVNVKIDNKSYRDYRADTKMGQDFYAYSTIKYYNVNGISFEL